MLMPIKPSPPAAVEDAGRRARPEAGGACPALPGHGVRPACPGQPGFAARPARPGRGPAARPARPGGAALLALVLALGGAAPALRAQTGPQPPLPTTPLGAGLHLIQAEVARSPEQRAIGLMQRRSLPPNGGMLFVFERPGVQCFWMKDTLLPLTIAFLADDGRIVNLADMQPGALESHCSAEPVRLALEMAQGWFAQRGLKPGERLRGAPFRKPDGPAR